MLGTIARNVDSIARLSSIVQHSAQTFEILILSRVYSSATNNNGFWIGLLDLLTLCTIAPNHSQLQ